MSEWKSVEEFGIPSDEKDYLVTHYDGDNSAEPWVEASYFCPEHGHVMWADSWAEHITHYMDYHPLPGE